MPQNTRVIDLVARWEERRDNGESLALDELCRECPELLPMVQSALTDLGAIDEGLNAANRRVSTDPDATVSHGPISPSEVVTIIKRPDSDTDPKDAENSRQSAVTLSIPGYEILAELGRGGMGVVYKAQQLMPKRIVALKMVLAAAHAGPAERARFLAEADAIAKLRHPNVVQVYEVGEYDGQPYFSLEYCEGGTLAEKLRGGPLPPEDAAGLLRTIAEAVHAAHLAGVVHRDLKPANILLTVGQAFQPDSHAASTPKRATSQGGVRLESLTYIPKVTDFGLAKQQGSDLTTSGTVMGTPSYMPPEQASGKGHEIGPAADIYSLGAILYCLLTGRPPFQAANAMETLRQVLEIEPISLRQLNAGIPLDLETIALKCLQKEPHKRYATAADVAADLQRFLACEPITARPVSNPERSWRWCRRNPVVASLTATAAITLLLGTVISSYFAVRANAKAEEARRSLYGAHMNLVQHAWENGRVLAMFDLLKPYETGSQHDDLRGFEWFYWDRLCHPFLELKGHTSAVESVAFSPDGIRLASASSDQTVKVWDATSGQETLTLKGHTGRVTSVAFSPDGKRLASGGQDQTVKVWDAASGQEMQTLKGHTNGVWSVAFSPDRKRLASASVDQTVKVWDAKSGQETLMLNGHSDSVKSEISVAFSPDGKRLVSVSSNKVVKLWDTMSGQETLTLTGHAGFVRGVSFSADGKLLLASVNDDQTVKVWDAASGQEMQTLKGHTNGVSSVAFSPDRKRLASASADQTVKVWDAKSGQETLTLKGHTAPVLSVAFSPDGKRLASGSSDQTIKVWDATNKQRTLTFKGHTDAVKRLAFADRNRLVLNSQNGTVRVWDAASGQEMPVSKEDVYVVDDMRFLGPLVTADGKRLASIMKDSHEVKVWDAASGQEMLSLKGYTGVRNVAFSPDGKRLAAVRDDQTVKVWDASNGQEMLTLNLNTYGDNFIFVAFSPDGKRLASASRDGTVIVWDARPRTP